MGCPISPVPGFAPGKGCPAPPGAGGPGGRAATTQGARGTARPATALVHVVTAPKGQLLSYPDHRPVAGCARSSPRPLLVAPAGTLGPHAPGGLPRQARSARRRWRRTPAGTRGPARRGGLPQQACSAPPRWRRTPAGMLSPAPLGAYPRRHARPPAPRGRTPAGMLSPAPLEAHPGRHARPSAAGGVPGRTCPALGVRRPPRGGGGETGFSRSSPFRAGEAVPAWKRSGDAVRAPRDDMKEPSP